jgi:hypothetical protein
MPLMEPDELKMELMELRADLRDDFQQTIEFRKRTTEKYQTDSRNARATQLLNKLINTVDDIPDHVMLAYGRTLDSQFDDSGIDAALRAVGFRAAFDSAQEFVESFIENPERFVWKDAIKGH